jgi:hypothetical protein
MLGRQRLQCGFNDDGALSSGRARRKKIGARQPSAPAPLRRFCHRRGRSSAPMGQRTGCAPRRMLRRMPRFRTGTHSPAAPTLADTVATNRGREGPARRRTGMAHRSRVTRQPGLTCRGSATG